MFDSSGRRLSAALREALLEGIFSAVKRLQCTAQGVAEIGSEQELRACLALARLAPLVLEQAHYSERSIINPDLSEDEVRHLLAVLDGKEPMELPDATVS